MPRFSQLSLERLGTCHPDLRRVMNEAIQYFDFSVLCGFRNQVDQDAAFNSGYSNVKWPYGKHNKIPSVAVDIAPYPIDWNDNKRFLIMAAIVLECASVMNVQLRWGGNWKLRKVSTLYDSPHFELVL